METIIALFAYIIGWIIMLSAALLIIAFLWYYLTGGFFKSLNKSLFEEFFGEDHKK